MKYLFQIFLILTPNFCVKAQQITQPARFEKEFKMRDEQFTIIPLREEGISLIRETNDYKKSNRTWEILLLDADLKERTRLELDISNRNQLRGYEHTNKTLYLLFRNGDTPKSNLEIIAIELNNFTINRYTIEQDLALALTHFNVVGPNFIFGGYVSNEPAVTLYETSEKTIRVIPGFFQRENELLDIRTNVNGTFNTILVDHSNKDNRKLIFKTFDQSGIQLIEDVTSIEELKTLQTGITNALEREDLLVLGAWGIRNSKTSNGFYSFVVNPFSENTINFKAFGELEHYLDYLKPRRADKIKAKTKAELEAGRIPSFTNYIVPYRILEHNKGYILLAESYNPSGSADQFRNYPPYNNMYGYPYPYAYNPYWGYYPGSRMYRPLYNYGDNIRNEQEIRTQQSVIIAFDEKGQIKWDQSMKVSDIKRNSIEQITDFCLNEKQVHLLYKKESEINIKSITLESSDVSDSTFQIKTLKDGDEIRNEEEANGGIRNWHGNTFYVWGYHTIRNKSDADRRSLQVFYINKIIID